MAKPGHDDTLALLDDDATSGDGLGMAAWGFAAVVAVVLGFASWQFAPSSRSEAVVAAAPEPAEVTGSIAPAGAAVIARPAREVGGDRIAPLLIAPPDQTVSAREMAQLRADLHDLQRRIAQMGLAGDGVSRRLDRLEERLSTIAAATARPAPEPARAAAEPPREAAPPAATETPVAPPAPPPPPEAVRVPTPRPEAEAPATTGSVPPKVVTATVKIDRETAAAPPPPATAPAVATPVDPAKATPKETAAPKTAAALDLGGYRSLASLKRAWTEASTRHGELGNAVEPLARLHETATGMEARLIVGPYADQTEAAKGCVRMRALGVACAVTGYTGQPLAAMR